MINIQIGELIISNGPFGIGGNIGGDYIRVMARGLAQDPGFGVDHNLKFSNCFSLRHQETIFA